MTMSAMATLVAWLVGGLAVWWVAAIENDLLHDERLREFAHVVLGFVDDEIDGIRIKRPGEIVHVETQSTLSRGVHYQVWSPQGELLLVSKDTPQKPLAPLDFEGDTKVVLGGVDYCVISLWNDARTKLIQVAEREDLRVVDARRVGESLAGTFLVSIFGLLLLNRWMVGRATRAIDQSAAQMLNRSPADLRPIVADDPPRELAPMLDRINALFGRMSLALESERNFSATAAHELRTPLAALRVLAQVADRAHSAKGTREALQQLGLCVDRASHMVDQLLTLARIEHTPLEVGSMCRIRLDQVASQVVADLQPVLEERGTEIDLRLASAELMSLEFAVAALVRNLVENAARYSPRAGKVCVETGTRGHDCFIAVEDSGPGIPACERERVFDPFYRLDNNGIDGCGVGLSIVRSVVRVHQARVVLSESKLGGLRAEVTFAGP